MRVAYVTTHDPADVLAWSGLVHFIASAIESQGVEVARIGPLREEYTSWLRWRLILGAVARRRGWVKTRHLRNREPALLRAYARQVAERLETSDADVVFSPETVPICKLKCRQPIVFWTDATFAGLLDYYEGMSHLDRESIRNGNRMEQEALRRCRLAIYSSEWARNSAIQNYNVNPAKVHVIPFGANWESARSAADIQASIEARPMDRCRLLFVGVDWHRKGGDFAVEVAQRLNESGVPSELDVVGCDPPGCVGGFVRRHGFLSKATPEGRQLLGHLFESAHFLILPSRAECYAVVFAEASSFGVPSLAVDTGGIPTAVRNGVNGQRFPVDAEPSAYCEYIRDTMSSPERYRRLAGSAFREYETRLNWSAAGRAAMRLIAQHCG